MAQVLAGIFLVAITIGVLRMVADVQIAKLKRTINELKDILDEN